MKLNTVRMRAQRAYPKATLKRCERCNKKHPRLHRHHSDYTKPLEVEILCPTCHAIADQELGLRPVKQKRPCLICETMFLPRHSTNKTCSLKCFQVLGARNANKRWKGHSRLRNCKNCGAQFEPLRNRAATCSRSCGNKLAWQKRKAAIGHPNG